MEPQPATGKHLVVERLSRVLFVMGGIMLILTWLSSLQPLEYTFGSTWQGWAFYSLPITVPVLPLLLARVSRRTLRECQSLGLSALVPLCIVAGIWVHPAFTADRAIGRFHAAEGALEDWYLQEPIRAKTQDARGTAAADQSATELQYLVTEVEAREAEMVAAQVRRDELPGEYQSPLTTFILWFSAAIILFASASRALVVRPQD